MNKNDRANSKSNGKLSPVQILGNQSGQGVIEYILVLIVTVAIILGVIYQLNDAFRVWANNYFGNYLSCLIESGELPALGGDDGLAGICDEQFQAFSIANGRPSSQAANTTNSSTPSTPRTSTASRGSSDARRSSGGGGSSGRTGRFGRNSIRGRGSSAGSTNKFGKGKTDSTGANVRQNSRIDTGSEGGGLVSEKIKRMSYGSFKEDKKGKIRIPLKGKTIVDSSQENGPVRLKARKPAAKSEIPDDEPWTFGDWLRILMIAAITIAIVVFLAGQVLQFSKSMD